MVERIWMRIDLAQDEADLREILDEVNSLMDCGYFTAKERLGLILKIGRKAGTIA